MRDVSFVPQPHSELTREVGPLWSAGGQIGDSDAMPQITDDLPNDVAALKAMILATREDRARIEAECQRLESAAQAMSAEADALAAEVARLTAQNERLDHIVAVLRRAQFGRRSERIGDEQIELALEDIETDHGHTDAAAEAAGAIARREGIKGRNANRGHLPKHLPREEQVIEPESKMCRCCGGDLHVIAEDVSERLDRIPARLRIIVTRRPRYACRACADGVVQAPAPPRLVEGGLPTEALVADIVVSKYEGIEIGRATLANWSASRPSNSLPSLIASSQS
jgi:transposase